MTLQIWESGGASSLMKTENYVQVEVDTSEAKPCVRYTA